MSSYQLEPEPVRPKFSTLHQNDDVRGCVERNQKGLIGGLLGECGGSQLADIPLTGVEAPVRRRLRNQEANEYAERARGSEMDFVLKLK